MNNRLPIYQFCLGNVNKTKQGLIFSNEIENNNSQSIVYSLPIIQTINHPIEFFEYIESKQFYFPFLLGNDYLELPAKIEFPDLVFTIPKTEFEIVFEIDLYFTYQYGFWWRPNPRKYFSKRNILRYVGKHSKIIPSNSDFIPILPVDLFEMDELYRKHKGVFVGLTPEFGSYIPNSEG
jgi:hypothetical protein